ncbi:PhzF family phenazine biosynthesis protein [Aspergillus homomorphus CBS 101889]|uniref:Diaminopimelate epimerase-like protein n=1 Tax=Aspergillus homomorphus (strain CBS 101889) TaxID=1450537 RepID=A0A395I5E9_ASPHC|nr:Diaminopimelate epimerase-like protein [Aspergillus homomorphus CBS 101889]RAL14763.1 Diaminopimelate epimerase-like protein [Aspergillus homomorphus CBS 101889]
MTLQYALVDVFTTTRFHGNPLAIVRVPAAQRASLAQETKQKIATEFNLSETVFLHEPPTEKPLSAGSVAIDIFTPKCEIPFAGHPTIGTACYILTQSSTNSLKELVTKAGAIPITRDSQTGLVGASIPFAYHEHQVPVQSGLVITGSAPVISIVKGLSFVLAQLPDLEALNGVSGALLKDCFTSEHLDEGWNEGPTGTKYFVDLGRDEQGCRQLRTRMFIGWEDPGTGSASSALACYLALKEAKELGTGPFHYHIVQGVEMGRRNDIYVTVERNESRDQISDVLLRGTAVLVGEGQIML